jgi:hypothetical protein
VKSPQLNQFLSNFDETTTAIQYIFEFYIDWCLVSFKITNRNVQYRKIRFEAQLTSFHAKMSDYFAWQLKINSPHIDGQNQSCLS